MMMMNIYRKLFPTTSNDPIKNLVLAKSSVGYHNKDRATSHAMWYYIHTPES